MRSFQYEDGVLCALRQRKLRKVCRLLGERDRLSWEEVSLYAPLAFHWSTRLLEWILELGPREIIYCMGTYACPGQGRTVEVCADLLTAAAAVDDLAAVEILLARGYSSCQGPQALEVLQRRRTAAMNAWYRLLFRSGKGTFLVDWVVPRWLSGPDTVESGGWLTESDPLAAAIWCGSWSCARRLLPQRAEDMSESAWKALRQKEDSPIYPLAAQKVLETQGLRREDCLRIGDFPLERSICIRGSKAFSPENAALLRCCLEREGGALNIAQTKGILEQADQPWVYELLPLIPPQLLACTLACLTDNSVLSVLVNISRSRYQKAVRRVYEHPEIHLTLDRNCVRPEISWRVLLDLIEHVEFTGAPPQGGLSGLAVALLNSIVESCCCYGHITQRHRHRLLYNSRTAGLLREEDPDLVAGYLLWREQEELIMKNSGKLLWKNRLTEENAYLILALLSLRKESDYEL